MVAVTLRCFMPKAYNAASYDGKISNQLPHYIMAEMGLEFCMTAANERKISANNFKGSQDKIFVA